jgi:hypothetical protein
MDLCKTSKYMSELQPARQVGPAEQLGKTSIPICKGMTRVANTDCASGHAGGLLSKWQAPLLTFAMPE